MKAKIIASLILMILASCSYKSEFAVISTKKVDLAVGSRLKKLEKRVTGEDVEYFYFVLPSGVPTIESATKNALEKIPGAVALVDVMVYYRWWYIPYIYGKQWYEVEGTPLVHNRYAFE
jgi:hypothetical protein